MAGDWIKWTKGLSRRREVAVIARKLNISRREAACACMEMWEWADDETADGHVRGATKDDLDSIIGMPGFSEVMTSDEVGWVRFSERGISFPRWDRNNGETAKKRLLEARKKQRQRKLEGKPPSPSKRDKCPQNVPPREEAEAEAEKSLSLKDQRGRGRSGSGRSKKQFEGDLDEATLRDEARFRKWVAREGVLPNGLCRSEELQRLAWSCRDKALSDKTIRNPVGFVKDTLMHAESDRVRQSHEENGREASREQGGAGLIAAGVVLQLPKIPIDPPAKQQHELIQAALLIEQRRTK